MQIGGKRRAMSQINQSASKSWLKYSFIAAMAAPPIGILLYGFLWQIFGFDPLHIGNAFDRIYDNHPTLTGLALSVYFIFFALKHGANYKKKHAENDLGWAVLLWICAAIAVAILLINVFVVDK